MSSTPFSWRRRAATERRGLCYSSASQPGCAPWHANTGSAHTMSTTSCRRRGYGCSSTSTASGNHAAVGAWLETTARRESLRALRTTQRQRPTDSEQLVVDTPVAPVDEQRLVATEERAAAARALTGLPHRQQRLLQMLCADPAPSYHEISLTLGMPIGSIGPTRARILARLRRNPGLANIAGEALG